MKQADTYERYSALGRAVLAEKIRIVHERHLAGEICPDEAECLREAMAKFTRPKMTEVKNGNGNHK